MAQAKRRLTNIRVKEVSLVDEAANLRRFIVVKRKGGQGMGKKNAELLKDDNTDVLKVSAEVKETLVNRGNEVIEKMKTLLENVDKIEIAKDGGDEVPGAIIEQFEEVVKAMPQFNSDDEEPEDFGLAKAAEEIKKAGKKISANRLEKIKDAFSILSGLLEEFQGDSGGAATTKGTTEPTTGHGGGNNMTTGSKDTETVKRSPGIAFTLAEAEVIKAREALEQAEESADATGIAKARESLTKAEADLKVAKESKAEADKAAEVEKAKEEADKANAALAKAKGESDEPKGENADVLKQILEGQKAAQEKLDSVIVENADLKKKLDEVSKTTQPSNSATDDGGDDAETAKKKGAESIEKGKAGSEFWGTFF